MWQVVEIEQFYYGYACVSGYVFERVVGLELETAHTVVLYLGVAEKVVLVLRSVAQNVEFLIGRLGAFHRVVFIQLVVLDYFYKFLGVFGVGGISGTFQPVSPRLVVGYLVVEEKRIPLAFEKFGVVVVRILGFVVAAEALAYGIVVLTHSASVPRTAALYAEVVVALLRQLALAGGTL